MKLFFVQKRTFFLFLGAFIIGGTFLLFWSRSESVFGIKAALSYPEISELEGKQFSFEEFSNYFSELARKKGAPYAFEVLKTASIPSNIDMHLLGHVVGDVLYKQEGLAGIQICTHDFRNACSHSIVVGLFSDRGEGALPQIAKACREAPGGSGSYTMCFHGLGHGILAYFGYDVEKALEVCKKTGTPLYHNREYIECVGGIVMEIIGGGFHDRELWAVQRKKYLNPKEPLSLCLEKFMPIEARPMCFLYLTPYLWEAIGADLGFPTPEDHERAFSLCDELPESDFIDRDTCYGGFGKEFIGLVLGRDIRISAIHEVSEASLKTIYEWCLLAGTQDGSAACIVHIMNSLYWGGENDPKIPIRFCNGIPYGYYQRSCFMKFIDAVNFYINEPEYKREFCRALPYTYREDCQKKLVN